MADLFGLAGYGSSGSDDEGQQAGRDLAAADSSTSEASSSSLDSADIRAAEAAARLKDFGAEENSKPAALPSAFAAFEEVDGPPAFLDPEATRPLVVAAGHGVAGIAAGEGASGAGKAGKERQAPGTAFDISVLAPKLKGQKRQTNDPRDLPSNAVIEGKAKRYKEDGPEATQQYSALTIALMGGTMHAKSTEEGKQPAGAAAGPRVPTKPMEVSEFLNKGIGAAQLPRKDKDRKDKEKEKRMKGQSAIGSWKTEAEMALRQQYDS